MMETEQVYHLFSQALSQNDVRDTLKGAVNKNSPLKGGKGISTNPLENGLITRYEQLCLELSRVASIGKMNSTLNSAALDDWSKESDCWTLLNDLLLQRQSQSEMCEDVKQQVSSSNLFASDSKHVNECLEKSIYHLPLREAITVKSWLERIAPPVSEDSVVSGDVSGGDPDALFSSAAKGSMQRQINYLIFSLLRRGELLKAIDICRENGQFWKAAALQGGCLFSDVLIDLVSEGGDRIDCLSAFGNQNIVAWKGSCFELSKQDSGDAWDRATYAALAGDIDNLLSVSHSWYDHLWANYNCLIEALLLETINQNSTQFSHSQNIDLELNIFRLPEKGVFETPRVMSIGTMSLPDLFFEFQKYFILNELGSFLSSYRLQVSDIDFSDFDESQFSFLRFITHVILALRGLDQDFWTLDTDCIILAYVKLLTFKERKDIVAIYLSFLPSALQLEGYSLFLQDIIDDRRNYFLAGQQQGLDMASIVELVVVNVFKKFKVLVDGALVYKSISFSKLDGALTSEDRFVIQILEWLSFEQENQLALLKYSCILTRHFFRCGKIHCIKELFRLFPIGERATSVLIGGTVHNEELAQFAALLDCFVLIYELDYSLPQELGQMRDKALEAIGNLLNGPLFCDTLIDDEYREILVIRSLYVPFLVERMHEFLFHSRLNQRECVELAELVAGSSSLFEAFLFSRKLPDFLNLMHQSALQSFIQ